MMIYVIRHGETELNKRGVLQGATDEPLNQAGRDIAAVTGRNMRGIHFDACISSPLSRARETAEIVLRESGNSGVRIRMDDRIQEINCGDIEGKKLMEASMPPEEAELFFRDPFSFPGFPNGENIRQVMGRTQDFLRELAARDDGKTYLVSTHGCALRAMLNFLYDDPEDYWQGHSPYNCAVSILESEDGKLKLLEADRLFYDSSLAVDRYKL